jgi:hypothetical protein
MSSSSVRWCELNAFISCPSVNGLPFPQKSLSALKTRFTTYVCQLDFYMCDQLKCSGYIYLGQDYLLLWPNDLEAPLASCQVWLYDVFTLILFGDITKLSVTIEVSYLSALSMVPDGDSRLLSSPKASEGPIDESLPIFRIVISKIHFTLFQNF